MESCAILVAQRMSPAADVWARGRKARAPATGVDGTGAAWPRSLPRVPCRHYISLILNTPSSKGSGGGCHTPTCSRHD